MTKRRKTPKPPAQIAAERRERDARERAEAYALEHALEWGIDTEAAALPGNSDVQVVQAKRGGKIAAERLDAFRALRVGMQPGAYDAVRRLERDMLQREGFGFVSGPGEFVQSRASKPRAVLMWEAGDRVKAALASIGERDAKLLTWLILPPTESALRFASWREVVAHVTGETHDHAQGAAVRAACANLAAAYERRMAA